MKKHLFIISLVLVFSVEIAALIIFAIQSPDLTQDTVTVNEAVQSVRENWNDLESHCNPANLNYVVLDNSGTVLYRTQSGLSETINMAVRHRDTILDIEVDHNTVGKIIIYNDGAQALQSRIQTAVRVLSAALMVQCAICIGYFLYLNQTIIKPFRKLKGFAQRIAGGNLDTPLEMDRQNLFGAFTESFDIMRSELKKARIAEAKANSEKKELVAKLSHDIKTPVASIKAASEVGAALASDEKIRDNYTQIIHKADQINTLITNLFTSALEELQQISVEPEDMASGELKAMLESADYLRRSISIPYIPDCLLYADKLRLQQVFDNIFANSYKYADTSIRISVFREGSCLAVSIEDYGGGVPPKELPLLKEKFKRGSHTENIEGAGLGLYISDYFMKEMRGDLNIENGTYGLKVTVIISLSGMI